MKRGIWRKLVSTVLVAGMVLSCAATSALAAEPDSVQEFRQGRTKMATIDSVSVVLQEDGSLWGWGRSDEGKLGNNGGYDDTRTYNGETSHFRTFPEKLLNDVIYMDVGDTKTIAIKQDGSLWSTGGVVKRESKGVRITNVYYNTQFIKLMENVLTASTDGETVLAVKKDGSLWKIDYELIRESGPDVLDISDITTPGSTRMEAKTPVKVMSNVLKIRSSWRSYLALQTDGTLYSWDGSDESSPVKVMEKVKDMDTQSGVSCAIKEDGSLWAWGDVRYSSAERKTESTPIKVADGVKAVHIDNQGVIWIVKEDGTITTWGSEEDISITNAVDISTRYGSKAVLKNDGSLWGYGNNSNYEFAISAGREITNAGVWIDNPIQLTGLPATASTPPSQSASTPTTSKVLVNGKEISFDAYSINDNNYFKLRDIANVLSGTGKQFEVSWDSSKNAINLISGQAYTAVGGELAKGDGSQKTAALNTSKVYLDGKEISLTAYTINDNNYFKLRDLGQTFNFGIGWDGAANTVTIDTSTGYTAE